MASGGLPAIATLMDGDGAIGRRIRQAGELTILPPVSGFTITTQDDLPGPDGDEPYTLFLNETTY
ncbi:MAG: hypothetical protein ACKOYK_00735, partial [Cyanobium sp.]